MPQQYFTNQGSAISQYLPNKRFKKERSSGICYFKSGEFK
jgi:hypothetical protein